MIIRPTNLATDMVVGFPMGQLGLLEAGLEITLKAEQGEAPPSQCVNLQNPVN